MVCLTNGFRETTKGNWSKTRFLRIARTLLRPKTYLLAHSVAEFNFNVLPYFFDYAEKNGITLIEPKTSPGRPKKVQPEANSTKEISQQETNSKQ